MTNPFKKTKTMFEESSMNSVAPLPPSKKKKENKSLFLKISTGPLYIRLVPVTGYYEQIISHHHEKLGKFEHNGAKVSLRVKCLKAKDVKAECPACDEAKSFALFHAKENGGRLHKDFFLINKDAQRHNYFLAYQYNPGIEGEGSFSENGIQFVDYKFRVDKDSREYICEDWDNLYQAIEKGMAAGLDPFDPENGALISINIKETPGAGKNPKKSFIHEVKKIRVPLPTDWKEELEKMIKPIDWAYEMNAEDMNMALDIAARLEEIKYLGLSEEEYKAEFAALNEAFFSIPNERIQKVVQSAKDYAERNQQNENSPAASQSTQQPSVRVAQAQVAAPVAAPVVAPAPAPVVTQAPVAAPVPAPAPVVVQAPVAAPAVAQPPVVSKVSDTLARLRASRDKK